MKATWNESASGQTYNLGHVTVASWYYDILRPKGDPKGIAIGCSLPGVKKGLGCVSTPEEARSLIEQIVEGWLRKTGLSFQGPA